MKNHTNIIIVILLLLFGSSTSFAVEYTEQQSEAPIEQQQDASKDVSLHAAQTAMETPQPISSPAQSIDDMVDQFLRKTGYTRGWNPERETYIAVGESVIDCEDPSYDDSFITKRSLKSMESILDGKSQIIEFIRTDMSAFDQVSTPGTDLNAQFKDKITKLQKKVDAQRRKLAVLLKEVDAAEAAALEGATFGDRLNRLMDAAIKKLDDTYSTEQIEEAKLARFEKIKQRYESASNECEQLEAQLKTLTGSKTESLHSKVETLSQMPLMGAIVLAQFEQWNEQEEKFRSAVIMIWSKKMETLVRAFISGERMTVPPGRLTLAQYIDQNDWSSASGGRRFRDNKGNVYFLGIGSAAVGSSASAEKRARGLASMIAKKEVATAIFADVSSHKIAEQMMESYNGGTGKDTSVAAENFASELKQSIEDRTISGLQSQFLRKVKHPISGQTIYVAIFAVSGDSARQAMLMEESNYLTRIMDIKAQQYQKGIKDGHDNALRRAGNDQSSYNAGKSQTDTTPGSHVDQPSQTSPASGQGGAYAGGGQDDAVW